MSPIAAPSTVLVTGAGDGIGKAVVAELSARGFRVFAGLRTREAVEAFLPHPDGSVTPVHLDVVDDQVVDRATLVISRAVGSGGLNGVVNAAGIIVEGPLELIPPAEFRRQLDVNVVGRFAVVRALLPLLRRGRGRIVNIGAISARTTAPFFAPAAVASAGFASLNDAMRMEFAPFGITVVLIEPGGIATGIFDKAASRQTASMQDQNEDLVAVYGPAITAAREAFARFGLDEPSVVVEAVMTALAGRSGPRVLVGRGARLIAWIGLLPPWLRDRVLMSSLGIAGALRPGAARLRQETTASL
jgi:NAD(P)-dependent dehydrogenase (short-subunit alcohol dehydrogenase family)